MEEYITNVSHSEKLHLSKPQKAERGRASARFFACKMEDMRVKWRGKHERHGRRKWPARIYVRKDVKE